VIAESERILSVVDSSAWIEYVTDGPNADFFATAIEATDRLLIPTITITEVFRWVLRERGEHDALQAIALMTQGTVVALDTAISISAARLGHQHRIPLGHGLVLASARAFGAVLWTQDADFAGLTNVQYRAKQT
jgi:toxin FitB